MSDPRPDMRIDQIDAANFLGEVSGRLLVADPGVGKSASALRATEHFDRVLIICNSSARATWPGQIMLWSYGRDWTDKLPWTHPTHVITSGSDKIPSSDGAGFVVVTHDLLGMSANKRLRAAIAAWNPQAVILDEIQYFANKGANRTKAVYGARIDRTSGLLAHNPHTILLSGTPQKNHQGELWTHYRANWPTLFGPKPLSYDEWLDRFCVVDETIYGRSIKGSKNKDILRAALDPIMMRVKKSDTNMPPLDFVDEALDVDAADIRALDKLIPPGVDMDDDDDEALMAWLSKHEMHIATARRALGLAKVPAALEWCRDFLETSDKKLLVFAYHTAVIDRLRDGLADFDPLVIDGRTGHSDRVRFEAHFQTAPNHRVLVGHVVAASTALTLTAASAVAIVEPSWTPTDNYQAACRAHRTGQNNRVLARFLYAPGTLDRRIMGVYRRKAKDIADLFD